MTRYDLLAVVVTLLFAIACYSFLNIYFQGRDFALDRDKIRVTDFHIVIARNQYGTNVVMSGVLTNESEYSWNIDQFQVRYLNSAGKIFDMDDNPEDVKFIVMPHSDRSFKLTLFERKVVPQYSDCEVKVVSASDPRERWNFFGY